jgi:hypothetical protein
VDSPTIRPPDPDQLFSKPGAAEPAGPTMLGARNVDSVLFNINDLDAAAAEEPAKAKAKAEPEPEAEPDQEPGHSGLIDVTKLVPEAPDGQRRPSGPTPGSLLAEVQARATGPHAVVAPPPNKAQTYILVVAILALLGVAVLLAIKALG